MELIKFGYSLKNIPLPSKARYLKCLIDKVESVIRRMRFKAHFFSKSKDDNDTGDLSDDINNFGFKSTNSPPQNEHLNAFEADMY